MAKASRRSRNASPLWNDYFGQRRARLFVKEFESFRPKTSIRASCRDRRVGFGGHERPHAGVRIEVRFRVLRACWLWSRRAAASNCRQDQDGSWRRSAIRITQQRNHRRGSRRLEGFRLWAAGNLIEIAAVTDYGVAARWIGRNGSDWRGIKQGLARVRRS
jgi:hypothetical protein